MAKQPKLISPTPGPWLIDEYANIYSESGEQAVTLVAYIYHQGSNEAEGRANARLIAQTQTMLNLLKLIHDEYINDVPPILGITIENLIKSVDPLYFTKTPTPQS